MSFRFVGSFVFQFPDEEETGITRPSPAKPRRSIYKQALLFIMMALSLLEDDNLSYGVSLRRVPLPAHIVGQPPILGPWLSGAQVAHIRFLQVTGLIFFLQMMRCTHSMQLASPLALFTPKSAGSFQLTCPPRNWASYRLYPSVMVREAGNIGHINGAVAHGRPRRLRQHFFQGRPEWRETLPVGK